MRVVFMGTPALAADILPSVAEKHEVVAVVTRPDAVRGRGKALVASPVKARALELGLPVLTPKTLRDVQVQETLADLEPDVACVVAYGAVLPPEVLDIPRFGCLNAHMSLLPRWRGAAPVQRAMLAGDRYTGVSIMRMEEGLDTGPYCLQSQVQIADKSLADIESELAGLAGDRFNEALELVRTDRVCWTEQDEAQVVYASKIEKAELMLSPDDSAKENVARVRASSDAHPARTVVAGRSVTVVRACAVEDGQELDTVSELCPGQAAIARKRLIARAADAPFEILAVKPDGKKQMDARAFAAGLQGAKGKVLTWGME